MVLLFTIAQAKSCEIAVVVKIGGIPWLNGMVGGVKKAAKEPGVNTYLVGPSTAENIADSRVTVLDLIKASTLWGGILIFAIIKIKQY